MFISVLILVIIFNRLNINFGKAVSCIKKPCFLWMAILIPFSLTPLFSVNRWKLFLRMVGINEKFFSLLKINFISMFEGMILPSTQGSDLLRIYHIEAKYPQHRGKAGSTVLIERIFGLILLLLFSTAAISFAMESSDVKSAALMIGLVASATFIGLLVLYVPWIYNLYSRITTKYKFLNSVIAYCGKFHHSLHTFPYSKVWFSSIIFISGFQLSTILSVHLLFLACGQDIPFLTNLALYPIISILSLLPITIGGFGVREGFFVYFYSKLGVQPEISVMVSIMNYCILQLLPAVVGGVLWYIELMKNDRKGTQTNE